MNFKKQIKEKGFKQSFLAEQIGISTTYMSLVINGHRSLSTPKELHLKKLLA